ncbi:hypothetical protein HDU76_006511 [Blyttiomyces sp. JEL0837]|nr:hypothetical protein HDU76_006511 [Blyttiomyces sp. JEL0837]
MDVFFPSIPRLDAILNAHLNSMTTDNDNTNQGQVQRGTPGEIGSRYWGGSFAARLDMTETDKSYVIHLDAPGLLKYNFLPCTPFHIQQHNSVAKNELNVSIKDDVLTISGERKSNKEVKDEHKHIVERSYGKFSRSIRLPNDCDVNNVQAKMDNGVLELTLAKTAPHENVKKIAIH